MHEKVYNTQSVKLIMQHNKFIKPQNQFEIDYLITL